MQDNKFRISADAIYTNLYGNVATQSVESLSGGAKRSSRPTSYVASVLDADSQLIKKSMTIEGGVAKVKDADNVYKSPYYYIKEKNPKALEWITATDLIRICACPQKAAIIVIPPASEMKDQINAVNEALKSEGLDPGKIAANEYIVSHSFPHKHYCLNVYGKDHPDNKEFAYRVPSKFPESGSEDIIRRTARSSAAFYFKCIDKNKILVSANEKFTSPNTLKFAAKCADQVFVFEGQMPEPTEFSPKKDLVVAGGGSKEAPPMDSYRKYFARLINYRHGDINAAAYDFIGALSIVGVPTKDLAKHYSSNYTQAAFEELFSLENMLKSIKDGSSSDKSYYILKSIYENAKIDDAHETIQKAYKPKTKKLSVRKAQEAMRDIYNTAQRSKNGAEANAKFINGMEKIYSELDNAECFKADLATSVVQSRSGIQAFQDACNLVDALAECKDKKSIFNEEIVTGGEGKSDKVSTALMNTIYENMYSSPFVGILCKETIPLPVKFEYTKKSRKSKGFSLVNKMNLFEEEEGSTSLSEETEESDEESKEEIEGGAKSKSKGKKCPVCGKPVSKCTCGKKDKCPVCGKMPCECKKHDEEVVKRFC